MKLSLSTLLSPYPYEYYSNINGENVKIGDIKSPTLKEIWNPNVTYEVYTKYLSFLTLSPKDYCTEVNKEIYIDVYYSLSDEEKEKLTIFNLLIDDKVLCHIFNEILDFFFVQKIVWSDELLSYLVIQNDDVIGYVNYNNFDEVRDIILQLCDVKYKEDDVKPKFKNKKAQYIWEKTQKAKKIEDEKRKKDLELSNILSKYSSNNHSSINITNVWEMTVYQLYNQFEAEQNNQSFDINKTSVACWGDSDNKFDLCQWFKT